MDNGLHIDSLGPATISRWLEFLDIFVAGKTTNTAFVRGQYNALKLLEPLIIGSATGASEMPLPALRFTSSSTNAAARVAFSKYDPRVRVLFNNGGSALGAGTFQPTGEMDFTSWPPAPSQMTRLYLNSGGVLTAKSSTSSSAIFKPDPSLRASTDLPTGNPWSAQPPYVWQPVLGNDGVGFVTAPFAHQTTIVGPSSLDLYLKSSALDTDLQATITEVRPNGNEVYVATGVLRASYRALALTSTTLNPVHVYLTSAQKNLPTGSYSLVRLGLEPIAHVFPAGTRLRVVITAPGGDKAAWTYATFATLGAVTDTIGLGGSTASSFVFNVVQNSFVLPEAACGALRGEPCRTYAAAGNGG